MGNGGKWPSGVVSAILNEMWLVTKVFLNQDQSSSPRMQCKFCKVPQDLGGPKRYKFARSLAEMQKIGILAFPP